MLALNPTPKLSSVKESMSEPMAKPREPPLEPKHGTKTNAKGTNDFVGVKNQNDKSIGKGSEFVEGQKVLYFPPKNHFLYDPKIPWCGPFMISNIHSCGAIDIFLNDHKPLKVYGKRLKSCMASTIRTIWSPK